MKQISLAMRECETSLAILSVNNLFAMTAKNPTAWLTEAVYRRPLPCMCVRPRREVVTATRKRRDRWPAKWDLRRGGKSSAQTKSPF